MDVKSTKGSTTTGLSSLGSSSSTAAAATTSAQTPITKYLANLDKRSKFGILGGIMSPSPSPGTPSQGSNISLYSPHEPRSFGFSRPSSSIYKRMTFDESFCSNEKIEVEESLLHISPNSDGTAAKKRRMSSAFFHEFDNERRSEKELEMDQKIDDLERILRETQTDLISLRAANTKLNQTNIEMRKSHMEKIIGFEKEEEDLKVKLRNYANKIEDLERALGKANGKEVELSENFQQQRRAQEARVTSLEAKVSELQKENFQAMQKLTQESLKSEETIRKLQNELGETQRGAEKWVMDSQVLRDQLDLAQSALQTSKAELKAVQLELIRCQEYKVKYENCLSSAEASSLEERAKRYENLFVNEQLKAQKLGKTLKKFEDENNILRSSVKSEMILQEQVMSLEGQIKHLTEELKEKAAAEAERNLVRNELNTWKSVASKVDTECTTPMTLESFLRRNQNLLLELKHENSELKFNNEKSERTISALQKEVNSMKEQIRSLTTERDKLALDLKRLSRRMGLIVKDRDGLKELKDSYEQEFEGLISQPLQDRIAQLESVITEYEELVRDDSSVKKKCEECESRVALVGTLQSQLEAEKREKETLSQTLAEFNQSCVEDPTTGFKIVSFQNNPSMLSIEARLKECLEENARLKEKVKDLEDMTIRGTSSGSALTDEEVLKEKQKLEDQLVALERKHSILTEAYNYETAQLQVACTKLFGFYVTLVRDPMNQIRLQSVYSTAAGLEEMFIFQEAENGEMSLLDTPILEHFRDDIERFLVRDGSIPAFVSSVTITYTQGAGQVSQLSNMDDDTLRSSQEPETDTITIGSVSGKAREVQVEVQRRRGSRSSSEEEDEDDEEQEGSEDPEEHDEEDYDEEDNESEEDVRDPNNNEDDDDDDVVMID